MWNTYNLIINKLKGKNKIFSPNLQEFSLIAKTIIEWKDYQY
jgi:hypothetical protein